MEEEQKVIQQLKNIKHDMLEVEVQSKALINYLQDSKVQCETTMNNTKNENKILNLENERLKENHRCIENKIKYLKNIIEDMNLKINEISKAMKSLKESLIDLRKETDISTSQIFEFRNTFETLNNLNQQLEKSKETLYICIKERNNLLDLCEKTKKERESTLNADQMEMLKLNEIYKSLQELLITKKKDNDFLRNQVQTEMEKNLELKDKLSKLKKEITDITIINETNAVKYSKEIELLQSDTVSYGEYISELENKLTSLKTEQENLNKRKLNLEKENLTLKTEKTSKENYLETLQKKISDIETDIIKDKEEHSHSLNKLQDIMTNMKINNNTIQQKNEELKKQIYDKKLQVINIKNKLISTIKQSEIKKDFIEKTKNEQNDFRLKCQGDISSATEEIRITKLKIGDKSKENDCMKAEIEEKLEKIKEIRDLIEKRKTESKSVEERQNDSIKKLIKEFEKLQKGLNDLKAEKNKRLLANQKEVIDKNQSLKDLTKLLEKKKKQVKDKLTKKIKNNYDKFIKEKSNLDNTCKVIEFKNSELRTSIENMKMEVTKYNDLITIEVEAMNQRNISESESEKKNISQNIYTSTPLEEISQKGNESISSSEDYNLEIKKSKLTTRTECSIHSVMKKNQLLKEVEETQKESKQTLMDTINLTNVDSDLKMIKSQSKRSQPVIATQLAKHTASSQIKNTQELKMPWVIGYIDSSDVSNSKIVKTVPVNKKIQETEKPKELRKVTWTTTDDSSEIDFKIPQSAIKKSQTTTTTNDKKPQSARKENMSHIKKPPEPKKISWFTSDNDSSDMESVFKKRISEKRNDSTDNAKSLPYKLNSNEDFFNKSLNSSNDMDKIFDSLK